MIRCAKKRTVLNFLNLGLSCLRTCQLRAQVPAATLPKNLAINEAYALVNDAEKQLFDLEIKAQRTAWVEENFHYRGHRADGRGRESGTDGLWSAPFPWSAPFREYFLTYRACEQATSSGHFDTSAFASRSGFTERACQN